MAAKAELFRQRVALPPPVKSAVPVDKEPAYVADFFATANVIQSAEPGKARPPVEAFAAAYPDSAGADLLACELEMRAKHAATAVQRCEAALSKYRYAERAHVLLGLQAARTGHPGVAEQHLETAIRQDPAMPRPGGRWPGSSERKRRTASSNSWRVDTRRHSRPPSRNDTAPLPLARSPPRFARVRLRLCMTASRAPAPLPAAGGPAWRELQSAHFRLRTDEDRDDAQAALSALEQFQAALLTVFRAPPDLPTGALPVLVVRNGWTDFADRQIEGWFTTALFQRLIVMQATQGLGGQETIKHELVHYLTAKVIPGQPPWLAEGLATYFQTLEVNAENSQVTVGRPPADLLRVVQGTSLMSVPEMMAAKQVPSERSLFYASTWATVHFLMNHHLDEFRAYEAALRDKVAPAEAWTKAFGALTPAALEAEIRAYLDGGQYALLIFPFVPAPGKAVPQRMLSDAEVHATRALLLLSGGQYPAARREFTESNGDYKDARGASSTRPCDKIPTSSSLAPSDTSTSGCPSSSRWPKSLPRRTTPTGWPGCCWPRRCATKECQGKATPSGRRPASPGRIGP